MRPRLIILSTLLGVVALAVALRAPWGETLAPDGSLLRVSLYGVTRESQAHERRPQSAGCTYLNEKGVAELCAPAPGADAAYAMLCAAAPQVSAGLFFAMACALVTWRSPFGRRNTAAALAGGSFVATLLGTTLAMLSMPTSLAALEGLDLRFGLAGYTAAWIAVGLLGFAAVLSTASGMLAHH